jgi:glycerol-3-phosphate acyltransferase PlsY
MPAPAELVWLLIPLAFGYLLGSSPFGLVFTKLAGLGDIRSIGSGNIGATNVLRTGNKKLAAATLLADTLKGTVAVLVAAYSLGASAALAAGLGAFLGHVFPVWLKFKGGKGVATFLGVLLGLFWPAAIAFGAVWLLTAAISRYSSLSALIASAATPFVLYGFGLRPTAILFALLAVVLWIKHRDNIRRLLAGTEGRIGRKAASTTGE